MYYSSRPSRNATGPHSRFVQASESSPNGRSMTHDYHTHTVSQTSVPADSIH